MSEYGCDECKDTGLCFDIQDLDPVEGYKMADRKLPCQYCKQEKPMQRRITTKTVTKNKVVSQLEKFLSYPIKRVSGVTVKVELEDGTQASFIYDGSKVITASSTEGVQPADAISTEVKNHGMRIRSGGGGTQL